MPSPSGKHITVEESGAFVSLFELEPTGTGLLTGLRFAVKDLIDISSHKTGCGNPTWQETHPPAATNAVCVDQLLAAGARFVGKTVTDELAFSLLGENFFYGTPLNPKAPDRVPGGSSSGSASAVACGLVDFAIGTDTGGSVRVPASNCGIFGLRPSHGFISVAGVNPFAPTFDTVGIFATSASVLSQAATVLLAQDIPATAEPRTIHMIEEAFAVSDAEVKDSLAVSVELLKKRFAGKVQQTSLQVIAGEPTDSGLQSWYDTFCTLQWAEIWSSLGAWIEETKPTFGPSTTTNFGATKSLDRRKIQDAARQRERYCRRLRDFLGPTDLLCIPTTPALAPVKGTIGTDRRTSNYYVNTLSLTAIAGLGRLPQVTLPLGEASGVPIGLSLLAAYGEDAFLLGTAQTVTAHVQARQI